MGGLTTAAASTCAQDVTSMIRVADRKTGWHQLQQYIALSESLKS